MAAKLREDYAIDALVLEADRRRKKLGRTYSYGMLIADTTPEERKKIAEKYRRKKQRRDKAETYRRSDEKDDLERFRKKHVEQGEQ